MQAATAHRSSPCAVLTTRRGGCARRASFLEIRSPTANMSASDRPTQRFRIGFGGEPIDDREVYRAIATRKDFPRRLSSATNSECVSTS